MSTPQRTAPVPAAPPSDFAVLLPPGWLRLPADEGAEPVVSKVLALRLSHLAPHERGPLQRALRQNLLKKVRDAQEHGALEVLLLFEPVRGRAVSAACTVSYLPPQGGDLSTSELLPHLHDDSVLDLRLEPVAGEMATRRLSRTVTRDEGRELTSVLVDYVLPVPATGGAALLLAFSTSTMEVADELVLLFDAMARSLRWVP